MEHSDLPALNASLNAASAICVLLGFWAVKTGRIRAHKALMLTAVGLSAAFLTSYVIYHLGGSETKFQGEGVIRIAYFAMLISHIILAVAIVPLVLITVIAGLRNRIDGHRRIARWTFPIWMYVSVTGVLVYFSLYGF